jgi:hypothetical protein
MQWYDECIEESKTVNDFNKKKKKNGEGEGEGETGTQTLCSVHGENRIQICITAMMSFEVGKIVFSIHKDPVSDSCL